MKVRFFLILVSFFVAVCPIASAQDFRRTFDEFTVASKQIHRSFSDSLNAAFSQAISSNWDQLRVFEAASRAVSPRPEKAPVAKVSDFSSGGAITVLEMIDSLPADITTGKKETRIVTGERMRSISFLFYGTEQDVSIPSEYGLFHPAGISEKDVGRFWLELADEDFSEILLKCRENRELLGYNDWVILEWVQALSLAIYPDDINSERSIFEVFILNQSGLMSKLARIDDRLQTMFAAAQAVFERKYTEIGSYKYYLTDAEASVSRVYTYGFEFSENLRPFDLRIKHPILLGEADVYSTLNFNSEVFGCRIELPINASLISFYGSYPQTTVDVYAKSVPDRLFSESLIRQLKPRLYEFDEFGRINELLRFLHYDFLYKTDDEQFGHEKQLFCEENFLYGFNDCEDRAVLFSYLVRRLAGSRVVLLEYEDHIAAAVRLEEDLKGSFVRLNDGKYYVCDPTFIGSKPGMCIKKYADIPAKVYLL